VSRDTITEESSARQEEDAEIATAPGDELELDGEVEANDNAIGRDLASPRTPLDTSHFDHTSSPNSVHANFETLSNITNDLDESLSSQDQTQGLGDDRAIGQENERQALLDRLTAARRDLASVTSECDQLKAQLISSHEDRDAVEAALENTQQELSAATKQLETVKEMSDTVTAGMKSMKVQVEAQDSGTSKDALSRDISSQQANEPRQVIALEEHEHALQSLRDSHENTVRLLEAQHEKSLSRSKTEHASEMAKTLESQDAALKAIKAAHKLHLLALQEESQTEVESLKHDYHSSLESYQEDHSNEIDALISEKELALAALEESHAEEISKLKLEISKHPTELQGVESKIAAVQDALRKELLEKTDDRDKLAQVVEDLKQEIDRCQVQLDADADAQDKLNEEAQIRINALQAELEEEKRRSQAAQERVAQAHTDSETRQAEAIQELHKAQELEIQKIKDDSAEQNNAIQQQAEKNLKELRERLEKDISEMQSKAADERTLSAQESDRLLQDVRRQLEEEFEQARANATRVHTEQLEKTQKESLEEQERAATARAELEATLLAQEKEIQTQLDIVQTELAEKHNKLEEAARQLDSEKANSREAIEQLQNELRTTQQLKEDLEQQLKEELHKLSTADDKHVEDLQDELRTLKTSESSTREVLANLRDALAKNTALIEEKQTEIDGHVSDLAASHAAIENLQDEVRKLQQVGDESMQSSSKTIEDLQDQIKIAAQESADANDKINLLESAAALHEKTVDELKSELQRAQQTASNLEIENNEKIARLQSDFDSLAQEKGRLEIAQADALTEKDNIVLVKTNAIEELEGTVASLQQELSHVQSSTAVENSSSGQIAEEFQTQIQILQHKLEDSHDARQKAEHEFTQLSEAHSTILQKFNDFEAQNVEIGTLRQGHAKANEHLEELRTKFDQVARRFQDSNLQIEQLEIQLKEATQASATAIHEKQNTESSLSKLQDELTGLQKVLDTFSQDSDERESRHVKSLASLSDQHTHEVEQIMAKHANDIAAVQKAADEQLHSAGIERDQNHAVALATLKGEYALQLAAAEEKASQDAHALSIERERNYEMTLAKMQADHAAQLAEVEAKLSQDFEASAAERGRLHGLALSELKAEHTARLTEIETRSVKGQEDNSATREREFEDALSTLKAEHASHVAKIESAALQQSEKISSDRDREHAAALAALTQEHGAQLAEIVKRSQDHAQSDRAERDSAHEAAVEEVIRGYTARIAEIEQSVTARSFELEQIHKQTVADLQEEHRAQLASAERLAKEALDASLRDRDGEHQKAIQGLVQTHELHIAEVERFFADREKGERSSLVQAHEGALAQLRISHAVEMDHLQETVARELEAARAERDKLPQSDEVGDHNSNQLLPRDRALIPPQNSIQEQTPPKASEPTSRGLSHIFFNHEPEVVEHGTNEPFSQPQDSLTEDLVNESIDEIPIAYIEGARDVIEAPVNDSSSHAAVQQLQSDNALLRLALNNAQEEITSLKSLPTTATDTSALQQTLIQAPHPGTSLDNDDVFTSSHTPENGLTLEGALHSLQMQTAQLLEINDDFLAEQDRWRSGRYVSSRNPSASVVSPSAS
jgi:chromosome segregation ATPase